MQERIDLQKNERNLNNYGIHTEAR